VPSYTPNTWTTGDVVTKTKLDRLEAGAAAALASADAATVATTGAYSDLSGKPTIPAGLPAQTGNSGKFLTTDGTSPSWGTPAGGGGSGLPSTVVNKTGAYTAASGDFVQADTTSAGFTVTLPAAPAVGALVAVKKVDATGNTLTIVPSGGGTIDGDANATTTTKMAGAIFEHVGSNVWRIVASMTTTGPAGPKGDPGGTGPQGPGFVARGAWATGTVYAVNDIVTNGGQTYRALTAHTAGASFSGVGANWELWAAKGADGTGGTITVQDEGSALTARSVIDFVGAGVTATDDAANSRTLVTIPGGGGGSGVPTVTRSGFYMTMPGSVNTSAPGVGYMTAMPLYVPACTIDRIGAEVTVAGTAGSVVRLGIYADSGSMTPGALILDAGTIDATTTGYKEITISQALSAGFVWFVACVQVAAATIRVTGSTPYVLSHTSSLSAAIINGMSSSVSTTTGALPSTFGTLSGATTAPRVLARAV
jgi:hypothetical protein